MVENGEKIKAGKVLVKIPRRSSKSGDITEVYLELQSC
jgi:DNA-directed RNA polymerase subunit beta'